MSVTITKDAVAEVLKQVRELTHKEVLVGIPDAYAGRKPDEGESQPISNAEIGYLMEFGSPAANIPARAHLVPGVEDALDPITKRLRAGAKAAIDGKPRAADQAMHAVGLTAQASVQRKITDGPFEPLSPKTLAKRRARGRTGEKPLIDTGQYRRAITYVIRPKGK